MPVLRKPKLQKVAHNEAAERVVTEFVEIGEDFLYELQCTRVTW